jgi:hypothetical protein
MPRKFLNTTEPSYAALYDVRSRELRTMAELGSPQSQILEASTDGNWVVWSEAADPGFFDWRIEAYNLATGKVTDLAQAVRQGGSAVPGPEAWPVVSNGHVIWSQALAAMQPGGGTANNAAVRLADLSTGAITTLATAATAPVLSWPWAAWQTGNRKDLWIEAVNLVGGRVVKIPGAFAELSMSGTSLVYNDARSLSLFVVSDVATNPTPELLLRSTDETDHLEWPTVSSRLIAWGQGSTTQVYDRVQQRFVTLPVTGLSAAFVAGPLLVWSSPIANSSPPPGTEALEQLNVVDVRDLPPGR